MIQLLKRLLNSDKHCDEWCQNCEHEVKIPKDIRSKCPICGEDILPCSMCDMDIVNCNDCKFELPI